MIKYKAVRVTLGGERVSLNVGGRAEILYERNRWIEGIPEHLERNLGICVFDNKGHASSHVASREGPFEIWSCEVDGKLNLGVFHDMDFLEQGMFVETPNYNFPRGTEMYKRIKLIERVSYG